MVEDDEMSKHVSHLKIFQGSHNGRDADFRDAIRYDWDFRNEDDHVVNEGTTNEIRENKP